MGARLLSKISEPPAGLHRGMVERRELGRNRVQLRCSEKINECGAQASTCAIRVTEKLDGPSGSISGRAVFILRLSNRVHVAKRSRGNIGRTRSRVRGTSATG